MNTIRLKNIAGLILFFFTTGSVFPVSAQEIFPQPGTMSSAAPSILLPPILTGMKVYQNNPLRFDFIVDKGNSHSSGFSEESKRLIRYFLASLTIPEKDLWVNLSPVEKGRIINKQFGETEMGRDLLAQDYILKQMTASVMNPSSEVGEKLWNEIYKQGYEKFGTTDLPFETLNKVWIVPDTAVVLEKSSTSNQPNAVAYIAEAKLKVMMEEDYLGDRSITPQGTKSSNETLTLIKNVIIPVLEEEVNEGPSFTQLRQVYHSLILAAWYKRKMKQSLLSAVYVNQNKIEGVNINDPEMAEKIWSQYVETFKKGAFDFIKEEYDPNMQTISPRKYFSGGLTMEMDSALLIRPLETNQTMLTPGNTDNAMVIQTDFRPVGNPPEDQGLDHTFAQYRDMMEKSGERFTQAVRDPQKVVHKVIGKLLTAENKNVKSLLPSGSAIVVAGFGKYWQELVALAESFPQCKIVGVDWLERNVRDAQDHTSSIKNILVLNSDIRKLDLSHENVSMIYALYIVERNLFGENIDDTAAEHAMGILFDSLYRQLAPNGYFINLPGSVYVLNRFQEQKAEILVNDGPGWITTVIAKKPLAINNDGVDNPDQKFYRNEQATLPARNSDRAMVFETDFKPVAQGVLELPYFSQPSSNRRDIERSGRPVWEWSQYDKLVSVQEMRILTALNVLRERKPFLVVDRTVRLSILKRFFNGRKVLIVGVEAESKDGIQPEKNLWIEMRRRNINAKVINSSPAQSIWKSEVASYIQTTIEHFETAESFDDIIFDEIKFQEMWMQQHGKMPTAQDYDDVIEKMKKLLTSKGRLYVLPLNITNWAVALRDHGFEVYDVTAKNGPDHLMYIGSLSKNKNVNTTPDPSKIQASPKNNAKEIPYQMPDLTGVYWPPSFTKWLEENRGQKVDKTLQDLSIDYGIPRRTIEKILPLHEISTQDSAMISPESVSYRPLRLKQLLPTILDLKRMFPKSLHHLPIRIILVADNTGTLTRHYTEPFVPQVFNGLTQILQFPENYLIVNSGDPIDQIEINHRSVVQAVSGLGRRYFITAGGGTTDAVFNEKGILNVEYQHHLWNKRLRYEIALSLVDIFYKKIEKLIKENKLISYPQITLDKLEVDRKKTVANIKKTYVGIWPSSPEVKYELTQILSEFFPNEPGLIYVQGAKVTLEVVDLQKKLKEASPDNPFLNLDFFNGMEYDVARTIAGFANYNERIIELHGENFMDIVPLTKAEAVKRIIDKEIKPDPNFVTIVGVIGDGGNDILSMLTDFISDKNTKAVRVFLDPHLEYGLKLPTTVYISNKPKVDGAIEVIEWLASLCGKTIAESHPLTLQSWRLKTNKDSASLSDFNSDIMVRNTPNSKRTVMQGDGADRAMVLTKDTWEDGVYERRKTQLEELERKNDNLQGIPKTQFSLKLFLDILNLIESNFPQSPFLKSAAVGHFNVLNDVERLGRSRGGAYEVAKLFTQNGEPLNQDFVLRVSQNQENIFLNVKKYQLLGKNPREFIENVCTLNLIEDLTDPTRVRIILRTRNPHQLPNKSGFFETYQSLIQAGIPVLWDDPENVPNQFSKIYLGEYNEAWNEDVAFAGSFPTIPLFPEISEKKVDMDKQTLSKDQVVMPDALTDYAMNGGVDLNSINDTLRIKNENEHINFNLDPAMLDQLQKASGFIPIIRNIYPLDFKKFFET